MIYSELPLNTVWLCVMRSDNMSPENTELGYALLSKDERERNARFRFERGRHVDLAARILMRRALGRYLNLPPASLTFLRTAKGKPFLADLPAHIKPQSMYFNLSHAEDYVVLAVAKQPVGVDIEYTLRKNDVLAIADHYFYGDEIKQLFAYPQAQQCDRFFDYWTLKEAYMKARGEGISLGLSNFGFQMASNGAIKVQLKPCLNDNPNAWQFKCYTPVQNYRLALAVKTDTVLTLVAEEFNFLGKSKMAQGFMAN